MQMLAAFAIGLLPLVIILQGAWVYRNKELFRRRIPVQVESVVCPYCGGAGIVSNPEQTATEMCPVCYGVGSKAYRKMNESEVLCHACGGMGRVLEDDGTGRMCMRCGGRGLISNR